MCIYPLPPDSPSHLPIPPSRSSQNTELSSLFYTAASNQLSILHMVMYVCFCSVALPCPTLCNPWTAAHQVSLCFTFSQNLLKLMPIKSVMPFNHLSHWRPLLLLPLIFPSIRVFSNESVLRIRWPKYWEFLLQHQSFQWKFRTDFH